MPNYSDLFADLANQRDAAPEIINWMTGLRQFAGQTVPPNSIEANARPVQNYFDRLKQPAVTAQYETSLSPTEERAFQEWKQQYAPQDSGAD
jgi:hypothetical protein